MRGFSVSCSSLASRLHAKSAATNFRGNLIPFLRAPTFAAYNYFLPSSLRPLSCLSADAGTHTRVHKPRPCSPQVFSLCNHQLTCTGYVLSLPLGTTLSAAPSSTSFSSYCQVLFPPLPLPIKLVKKGLLVCLQCLSGLAGPYFCCIEIPPGVASTGCFHTFVWRCHFCSMSSPLSMPSLDTIALILLFPLFLHVLPSWSKVSGHLST